MKTTSLIAAAAIVAGAICATHATAQNLPCQNCQSPGCSGHHPAGGCCDGLCAQAPPNPLAPGRPSPAPCCADGICYPNCTTWGHYGTRWRRWPIEFKEMTAPGAITPGAVSPDLEGYSPPTVDEEDRRAPPPSVPRSDEQLDTAPRPPQPGEPGQGPAGARPGAAPTEAPAPPASQLRGPSGESPSLDAPFGIPNPETPGTMPTPNEEPPLPDDPIFNESSNDADRPPAPPFAAPRLNTRPTVRSAGAPAQPASPRHKNTAPQEDPPPALPGTLASLAK